MQQRRGFLSGSPLPPRISFARRPAGSKSWTDRHAGISRMQPTDIRPLTDMWQWSANTESSPAKMWGQHLELGFQPLRQHTLLSIARSTADLPSTTTSPVVALPPPLQTPSSTAGSRLPRLHPDPRISSSYIQTVFSVGNNELDERTPESMLQDLSKYITKDGDYAIARGWFGEI